MSALKQVFVRVHLRYEQDWYAEDLERFAAWLIATRYQNKNARRHLCRVQQVLHAIGAAPGAALRADVLERAFAKLARRWTRCHTASTYAGYLRSSHSVSHFLQQMLRPGQPLTRLTPRSLETYIESRSHQVARTTLLAAVRGIRAFLLDCYNRRLLPERLDHIDMPRAFRRDLPPRAMPWPLVERLLQSVDRSERTGCRDHAILHLLACYGLRTGEVARLTLDSIDRERRTLTVWQSKTYSSLVVPLHDQTLAVLDHYLQAARPRTETSWLFLRAAAPLGPMSKSAVSYVFRSRADRIGPPVSQYSAHCLRHAFAHRLFQQGVGMKAIGDLMGHRSLVSTSIYLRLQVDALRGVALTVPGHAEPIGGVA